MNCYQLTVWRLLLHLKRHLYKIIKMYKNTRKSLTKTLTFSRTANEPIRLFNDYGAQLKTSYTVNYFKPVLLATYSNYDLRLKECLSWDFLMVYCSFSIDVTPLKQPVNQKSQLISPHCQKVEILQFIIQPAALI